MSEESSNMMMWKNTVARYYLAGLVGLAGAALSLGGFQVFKNQDQAEARHTLEDQAQDYVAAIEDSLIAHLEPLHTIAGLFDSVATAGHEEFHTFTKKIRTRIPDIQALEWIPRVPSAERRAYESRARDEGHTGFRISERDAGGGMVPAGERPEYYPVFYVEPLKGNEKALGFDLASNGIRRADLAKARDTGNMVISGRIRLLLETGEGFGFLAFLPVYTGNTPPDSVDGRRRKLTGFTLGVFRIPVIVEAALAKRTRPAGLDIYLLDDEAAADSRLLYFHPSRTRDEASSPKPEEQILTGFLVSKTIAFADRHWTAVFKPVSGYFSGNASWTPWMVLMGGLAFTGMLLVIIVSAIDRERKISLLVDKQTSALRRSDRDLQEKAALEELLGRATIAANEADTVDEAMKACLDEICAYAGWAVGHVYLSADDATGILKPSGIWHLDDAARFEAFRRVTDERTFRPGIGLPGRVYAFARPEWIEDLSRDENFLRAQMGQDIVVKAGVAFPVIIGGDVVAVLELFSDAVAATNKSLLRTLLQIGVQLGRTIERKQAERTIRENEERTRSIVDNVVDGIITINELGIIQSVNQATNRIFGFVPGELEGRNVKILAAEPFREAHDGYLANYMKTGDAKIIGIGREVVGQRRDGASFPMELAVSNLKLAGEQLFVGVVRDISERKEVDRMKSEFVSTVSHELRTPLTSIRGSLGLIKGGAVGEFPEKAAAMLNLAHKNTERLINLVNDILDMEKIELGRIEFQFNRVDMNELAERAIDANQGFAMEYGVDFEITGTAPETQVWGDKDRLAQVMANLLSNAAKFSPNGTKVWISITRCDGTVRVSVTDQGPGIQEEFRGKIFDKFTQADQSDTRKEGGTGLGLNVSRAIIDKHGGTLDYDSEAGAGATFYFDLPEFKSDSAAGRYTATAPDHRPRRAPASGSRILICEDDPDIANLISRMLQQDGYDTDIAHDADEAKEILAEQHFDAMTVDIMLPGQDGISLIRDLRAAEETKDLTTVVVSAKAEEAAQNFAATTMGIVDWLAKPLNENRLLDAVRKAVSSRPGDKPRILYVEDDTDLVGVITTLLGEAAEVVPVFTFEAAQEMLRCGAFDLAIIDIVLPDGSGLDLLPLLKNNGKPSTPVILFSGEEVGRDTALKVEAALIKSRTTDDELLATIESLIDTKSSPKYVP